MLRSAQDAHELSIQASVVRATDGDAGRVGAFLFDDEDWTIRYLVVATGNRLSGRVVMVRPCSINGVDRQYRLLHVGLTREQVEASPSILDDPPVSVQREEQAPVPHTEMPYWGSGWEAAMQPAPATHPVDSSPAEHRTLRWGDSHLRSTSEVLGYSIHARDGKIGHVEDFVVDDEEWVIRYVAVDTRDWLPAKKVLLSPAWIPRISWTERELAVDLGEKQIENAPKWNPRAPIDRGYERRLHAHYGRPPYFSEAS